MKKIKTVFMGTPDFSVPALEMLHNHPLVELHSVVSMPSRKAGRGHKEVMPPVAEFATNNKIRLVQSENINNETDYLNQLRKDQVDLIIVLAFAQFLKDELLNIATIGCFNIHTSLLPKYRGAAPIQYALLNDDKSTGVSIQKMVKKMDAGDTVISDPVAIAPNETGGQLHTKLKFQAALSLNTFIEQCSQNNLTFTAQDESQVTFAPTLKREDGQLNFGEDSAYTIYNKFRAFYPWPGVHTTLNGKRLKVLELEKNNTKLNPFEISTKNNQVVIGCKEGSLRLTRIQLEGKKACTDTEFLNGFKEEFKIGQ